MDKILIPEKPSLGQVAIEVMWDDLDEEGQACAVEWNRFRTRHGRWPRGEHEMTNCYYKAMAALRNAKYETGELSPPKDIFIEPVFISDGVPWPIIIMAISVLVTLVLFALK